MVAAILNKKARFFDQLSPNWHRENNLSTWEKELIQTVLSPAEFSRGGIFLDLGGGTGRLSEYLGRLYSLHCVILDFSYGMLREGRENCPHDNLRWVQSDVHEIPLLNESVRFIFSFSSFPHFERKEEVLRECYRVLEPGGSFIILHSSSRDEINLFHSTCSPVIAGDFLPALESFRCWGKKMNWSLKNMKDNQKYFLVHFIKPSTSLSSKPGGTV